MPHSSTTRETARAQDAWGKFNTAPAWNRHHAAAASERTPLHRAMAKAASWFAGATATALGAAMTLMPMVRMLPGLTGGN